MVAEYRRKVNERGQFTIPKAIREDAGIDPGDELVVTERNDSVVIEKPADEAELAEGYRKRADRARDLSSELEQASAEATDTLGDAPDWE